MTNFIIIKGEISMSTKKRLVSIIISVAMFLSTGSTMATVAGNTESPTESDSEVVQNFLDIEETEFERFAVGDIFTIVDPKIKMSVQATPAISKKFRYEEKFESGMYAEVVEDVEENYWYRVIISNYPHDGVNELTYIQVSPRARMYVTLVNLEDIKPKESTAPAVSTVPTVSTAPTVSTVSAASTSLLVTSVSKLTSLPCVSTCATQSTVPTASPVTTVVTNSEVHTKETYITGSALTSAIYPKTEMTKSTSSTSTTASTKTEPIPHVILPVTNITGTASTKESTKTEPTSHVILPVTNITGTASTKESTKTEPIPHVILPVTNITGTASTKESTKTEPTSHVILPVTNITGIASTKESTKTEPIPHVILPVTNITGTASTKESTKTEPIPHVILPVTNTTDSTVTTVITDPTESFSTSDISVTTNITDTTQVTVSTCVTVTVTTTESSGQETTTETVERFHVGDRLSFEGIYWNIRSSMEFPKDNSNIVGKLYTSDVVYIDSVEPDGWYKLRSSQEVYIRIALNEELYFIANVYETISEEVAKDDVLVFCGTSWNLRNDMKLIPEELDTSFNVENNIVKKLTKYQRVTVVRIDGNWYLVKTDGGNLLFLNITEEDWNHYQFKVFKNV